MFSVMRVILFTGSGGPWPGGQVRGQMVLGRGFSQGVQVVHGPGGGWSGAHMVHGPGESGGIRLYRLTPPPPCGTKTRGRGPYCFLMLVRGCSVTKERLAPSYSKLCEYCSSKSMEHYPILFKHEKQFQTMPLVKSEI